MDAATVVNVPGLGGSGPEHWQSYWERQFPRIRRVVQADWEHPRLDAWMDALQRTVASVRGPVVLVAHSLGCALVVHWLRVRPAEAAGVRGALLVAPSDVDSDTHTPPEAHVFRPMPLAALPCRSTVVLSSNDPYVSPARGAHFALSWKSRLVSLGPAGHINSDSNLRDWPVGQTLLRGLTRPPD